MKNCKQTNDKEQLIMLFKTKNLGQNSWLKLTSLMQNKNKGEYWQSQNENELKEIIECFQKLYKSQNEKQIMGTQDLINIMSSNII